MSHHDDYWKLSQLSAVREDAASQGKELTAFLQGIVDEDSMLAFAEERARSMLEHNAGKLPPDVENFIIVVAATALVDGFLLGHDFGTVSS